MKTFDTFEEVKEMKDCMKKAKSKAVQIHEDFQVNSMEGLVTGKAGDYLMKGVNGELYICDREST